MLFHQEMNSEVNGSVQEQTSGKGVPPSSVGAGGPRARTTGLSQAQPPAPLPKAEAAYLLCSLGPPRLTLPTPPPQVNQPVHRGPLWTQGSLGGPVLL